MRRYKIIGILIMIAIIVSCNNSEQNQEVSDIITYEKNNMQLYNFAITYDTYKENIDGILDESARNIDEEVIFGIQDQKYYGKDLIGLSIEEMAELRTYFFDNFPLYDLYTQKIVMKTSQVYREDNNTKVVYSIIKYTAETRKEPITMYHIFKYTFSEFDGKWKINDIKELPSELDEVAESYESGSAVIEETSVEFGESITLQ